MIIVQWWWRVVALILLYTGQHSVNSRVLRDDETSDLEVTTRKEDTPSARYIGRRDCKGRCPANEETNNLINKLLRSPVADRTNPIDEDTETPPPQPDATTEDPDILLAKSYKHFESRTLFPPEDAEQATLCWEKCDEEEGKEAPVNMKNKLSAREQGGRRGYRGRRGGRGPPNRGGRRRMRVKEEAETEISVTLTTAVPEISVEENLHIQKVDDIETTTTAEGSDEKTPSTNDGGNPQANRSNDRKPKYRKFGQGDVNRGLNRSSSVINLLNLNRRGEIIRRKLEPTTPDPELLAAEQSPHFESKSLYPSEHPNHTKECWEKCQDGETVNIKEQLMNAYQHEPKTSSRPSKQAPYLSSRELELLRTVFPADRFNQLRSFLSRSPPARRTPKNSFDRRKVPEKQKTKTKAIIISKILSPADTFVEDLLDRK